MPYNKRPGAMPFNPNRLSVDLSTLNAVRLNNAAKEQNKSANVLAALIVEDWIEKNTPRVSLDDKAEAKTPVLDINASREQRWRLDSCHATTKPPPFRPGA